MKASRQDLERIRALWWTDNIIICWFIEVVLHWSTWEISCEVGFLSLLFKDSLHPERFHYHFPSTSAIPKVTIWYFGTWHAQAEGEALWGDLVPLPNVNSSFLTSSSTSCQPSQNTFLEFYDRYYIFWGWPGVRQEVEGGLQGPDRSIARCTEAPKVTTAATFSPGRGSEDLSPSWFPLEGAPCRPQLSAPDKCLVWTRKSLLKVTWTSTFARVTTSSSFSWITSSDHSLMPRGRVCRFSRIALTATIPTWVKFKGEKSLTLGRGAAGDTDLNIGSEIRFMLQLWSLPGVCSRNSIVRAGGDPEICVLPASAADVQAIFRNLLTMLQFLNWMSILEKVGPHLWQFCSAPLNLWLQSGNRAFDLLKNTQYVLMFRLFELNTSLARRNQTKPSRTPNMSCSSDC